MGAPVEFSSVRRVFGSKAALDGLSWHAPEGGITCVLGPNGAGKSTAIDCAVGLQRPDGGTVRVLGRDPADADADHRARVGVMLQSGGLPNGATPARLLTHLARFHSPTPPARELAERLGIVEFERTPVRRLSGGQKQRVALAAALLGDPRVVFLDEPSAGLDPHGRLEVWDLVTEARDAGRTLVVTTHSFEEAQHLGDHVVIMSAGRTRAEGDLAAVAGTAGLERTYFELTRGARG